MWLWFADRGFALVGYATLWFALLTGVFYNARASGWLHRASKPVHVPASVIASVAILGHAALGIADTWAVLAARVPHPAYSDAWLALGAFVGLAALLLIVTSVLGFLDARRFQRPWDPRAVHALAYGGFVFSTLHAVALGSDVATFGASALVAAAAFLLVALAVRVIGTATNHPPQGAGRGP